MTIHKGVAPLDPASKIGQYRLLLGDSQFTELNPPEEGFGNYGELSDDEIEAFLSAGGDSVKRGIGFYMLALSQASNKHSRSVKDYDLLLDTTKRPTTFRELAKIWFDLADKDDADQGLGDIFEAFPTGSFRGKIIPEGTLPEMGREYTWVNL